MKKIIRKKKANFLVFGLLVLGIVTTLVISFFIKNNTSGNPEAAVVPTDNCISNIPNFKECKDTYLNKQVIYINSSKKCCFFVTATPTSNPVDVINRLRAWASERPFTRILELKARWDIVNAAITDIRTPLTTTRFGILSQDQVLSMTKKARESIEKLFSQKEQQNTLQEYSINNQDSVTGELFITKFRKETDGTLVAEEVRPETFNIISQAKINPNGNTKLTLNFIGKRFNNNNNPMIIAESKYLRATATLFNLLVGTIK